MGRDRGKLSYANVTATVAVILAFLAAGPVVAKPVVDATTSATSAVKRALGLSKAANRRAKAADKRSKKAIEIARRALNPVCPLSGCPSNIGIPGPPGVPGPEGPPGPPGSDAEFNGAAAGGDLEGAYPNPLIAVGAVGPDHFGTIPAVSAYAGSGQSITHEGAGESIELDIELFDTAEMHSTVTDKEKLFAPVDGIYQVNASVNWVADPDGFRQVFLRKNGVESTYATDISPPASGITSQSISALIPLDEGDYVDARVFQNSGGGELSLQALGSTPVVSMVWVAPQ